MPATKYSTTEAKQLRYEIRLIQERKLYYRNAYITMDCKLSVLLERCRELGLEMNLKR